MDNSPRTTLYLFMDISPVPLPPPRRESFHLSPTGTNPPDYSSLIALANDLSPGMLTFTKNEKAVLKESHTVRSTASYSYSETRTNPLQQANPSTVPNDISNLNASATANIQERKVSSLKLTPVTIPDPPAHSTSYIDPQLKTPTTCSPPLTSPPPRKGPTLPHPSTQTTSLSVHLGTENLKNAANPRVEVKVPDQAPNQTPTPTPTPAPSLVEMTKPPPAIPPRPSPAELLVHK
ncbi:putative uncharacterized protein DDB_G0290521 [Brachyistius frenatus]|uniref:putative uncharacterized protein DDB_G0290521 n=1 Tax=Brachyistius frenatus TaxID=100188 RepID=UPI0037E99A2F